MSRTTTETYRTSSSEETRKLGHEIGLSLTPMTAKNIQLNGPVVIALEGNLGAGKTTFVQGFLNGLGIKKHATSPTFILMRRHALSPKGIGKNFANLFHIDAYRLKKPDQLDALGLDDIFKEHRNIVLIEWPEQAKALIPKNALRIRFMHGKKENERTIKIKR